MRAGDEVTVRSAGTHPAAAQSLRDEHGDIFGRRAIVIGASPQFHDSFLVEFVYTPSAVERLAAIEDPEIAERIQKWNGKILDLHVQWFLP